MVLVKIASFAALAIGDSGNREYQMPSANQVNFRGRCAWGMPCDNNRISYGCELMTGNLGFCWSECAGYLPKVRGQGVFLYEGWCYNINNDISTFLPEENFSGKIAKSRKRRARMSKEALEALKATEDEDIEVDEEIQTFEEPENGFLMGRPHSFYHQCTQDSDCASIARQCAIGCSNREEAKVTFGQP